MTKLALSHTLLRFTFISVCSAINRSDSNIPIDYIPTIPIPIGTFYYNYIHFVNKLSTYL